MDWRHEAACGGRDVNIFFPSPRNRAGILSAKAICRECPVVSTCLDEAMAEEGWRKGRHGVRGGKTAEERAAMVRSWKARKSPTT